MPKMITHHDISISNLEYENLYSSILNKKYLMNDETTYSDIINRLIKELKQIFPDVVNHTDCLKDLYFIPGGSILSGLGNNKKCSLSNCYVIPIERDSLDNNTYGNGIGETITKMMRTFSYRGGVGTDITVLRPKNSHVDNTSIHSTGAVSFMPLLSLVTNTIGQNGRRGATMISMDIRHPDILDFIESKSYPEKIFGKNIFNNFVPDISGANISCKITDEFMEAVRDDRDWDLVFPDYESDRKLYENNWNGDYDKWKSIGGTLKTYSTVKAKYIMERIAHCAWKEGCPGILFMDTVIDYSPAADISKKLKPITTNPCGEIPAAEWENCLLGALNLPKFVIHPWTMIAKFDFDKFSKYVSDSVILMNYFSEFNMNMHPHKEQRKMDAYSRRIGLEITGLADTLAMLNYTYDSPKVLDMVHKIFACKSFHEIRTSCNLAKTNGCCEPFSSKQAKARYINGKFFKQLVSLWYSFDSDPDALFVNTEEPFLDSNLIYNLISDISVYGLRNAAISTIGPTGTLSIIANNCTSGIEPLFSFNYERNVVLADGKNSVKTFNIVHPPLVKKMLSDKHYDESKIYDIEFLKSKHSYKESHEINYINRIDMQSVIQQYVDQSISSTINLPNEISEEEIYSIYMYAWTKKLKGVTVFRDGCKMGVLNKVTDDETTASKLATARSMNISMRDMLDKHNEVIRNSYITKTDSPDVFNVFSAFKFLDPKFSDNSNVNLFENNQKSHEDIDTTTIKLPKHIEDELNTFTPKIEKVMNKFICKELDDYEPVTPSLSKEKEKENVDNTLNLIDRCLSDDNKVLPKKVEPRQLKNREKAERIEINWNGIRMYVTITLDEITNKPLEIFINPPYELGMVKGIFDDKVYFEKTSMWHFITRLISLMLRANIDISVIIKQLEKVTPVNSITHELNVLLRVLYMYQDTDNIKDKNVEEIVAKDLGDVCPECGKKTYVKESGCGICKLCGYTTCG